MTGNAYLVLLIAEQGIVNSHFSDALTNVSDIELVVCNTGADGTAIVRKRDVDVVILDIGSEKENTLPVLRRILKIDADAKVIMASTLNFSNVRQGMKGFEQGAVDLVNTPASYTQKSDEVEFTQDIRRMVRSLSEARRSDTLNSVRAPHLRESSTDDNIVLRPASNVIPEVLAIGSSTGGPQALTSVLNGIACNFRIPIFVTQHMPKGFTGPLAKSLANFTGKTVVEAEDGMLVSSDCVYIAPGDFHMTIGGTRTKQIISLNQEPKINFCRPSVDPMIESIVSIFHANTLLLILTGMGSDGTEGAKLVAKENGTVIAQDSSSSVVWGMPGSVAKAGLCSHVLPIDEIPATINRLVAPV